MLKRIRWSANLAYAVGLIATDGCLSIDGRHIDLTSKDIEQCKAFSKILGLTNKIGLKTSGSSDKEYYRVNFSNVGFYKFLLEIGLSPHKSLTIGKLDIPCKYFRDFIRGHLDGDGNITTYQDSYVIYKGRKYNNYRLFVRFFSASIQHLLWMQQMLFGLLNINGAIIRNNKANRQRRHLVWYLKYSKKESIKLLNWIYYKPDLPCLERKEHMLCRLWNLLQTSKESYTQRRSNIRLSFELLKFFRI